MMSLTFGLFTQVSGSGPLGPLVSYHSDRSVKPKMIPVLAFITQAQFVIEILCKLFDLAYNFSHAQHLSFSGIWDFDSSSQESDGSIFI